MSMFDATKEAGACMQLIEDWTYQSDSIDLPLQHGWLEYLVLEVEDGLELELPLYRRVDQRLVVVEEGTE
jgi:hypothetical protein